MSTGVQEFLLAGVLAVSLPGAGQAYCPFMNEGPWEAEQLPVRVFLNEGISASLCNANSCPTNDEIRRTVEVVLDEFHDNAGSNLSFDFMGMTDLAPATNIANAIHIYGGNCNGSSLARTAWAPNSDGNINRANMRMCSRNGSGPIVWSSFAGQGDGTRSFHAVLSHELMHAVGFDHPDQWCSQNFKSVVRQFYSGDEHHLYPDDFDGLQALYGKREDEIGHIARSFDGADWSVNGPHLPHLAAGTLSRFGACDSTSAGGFGRFVGVDDERNLLQFYGGNRFNWSWLSDGLSILGISEYSADVACRNRTEAMAAWICGTSLSTGDSSVCVAHSTDGNSTWGNLDIVASGANRTRSVGVDAAYDPVSDSYVTVWRNSNEEIVSKVVHPNASIQRYQNPQGASSFLRASDSVSIACAPRGQAGDQNCVLAWADTGWSRTLRWAHANVVADTAGPRLVLGDIRAMGYIIYGTPSVAFSGHANFPWHIAFHQGQQTVFTLRKRADTNSAWQNEQQYSAGQRVVNPSLAIAVIQGDDVGTNPDSGLVHSILNASPDQ